jgi:hypothetical protein
MRVHPSALLLGVSLLVLARVPVTAQSLADLARQEEERRRSVKTESKVYTNKDLPSVPSDATPATSPLTPAAQAGEPPKTTETGKTSDLDQGEPPTAGEAQKRDEAYWSGRMKDLRTALERDETYLAALQSRINALTTDFVNRDDPAQRALIAADRDRAITEFERLRKQIEVHRKTITDLQDEARRASVPPGWLR